MSVSSAMYAAITGLEAMGTAMSVISNNIANVNTIGFKASRANFADLLSQSSHTASGARQIGRGVQVGAVTQIFSQGSFQNSAQDTDLAIAGEGFFQVEDQITNEIFYTRAGNFIFDKDGRMMTPGGYVLQGWALDNENNRVGTPTDVIMSDFNSPPEVTTLASMVINLDSRAESRTDGTHLSTAWNGSNTSTPMRGQDYVYQTAIRIYDSLGDGHDLSIYFDPDDVLDNTWDYVVTCNPLEDRRVDSSGDAFSGSTFAGLLQRGTITFEPTDPVTGNGGAIRNITAENLNDFDQDVINPAAIISGGGAWGAITPGGSYTGQTDHTYTFSITSAASGTPGTPPPPTLHWDNGAGLSGDLTLSSATATYAVAEGLTVNFAGAAGLANGDSFTVLCEAETATWSTATPNNDGYFELTAAFVLDPDTSAPVSQNVGINLGARNPLGIGTWESDSQATTQYAGESTTLLQTQDGYPSGYLQAVSIDPDGVVTGTYSNGRNISTYQLGLSIFRNQWGLEKVGNNLYRQTRDSGEPTTNPPGTGGAGEIAPNSLEQSNVDLANEFVEMIIQQRGFQANSKVITTTDTMLAELINLKR